MNNSIVHFKISSRLKDLIGQELINDDFIAVFELVKNSFDAFAKNVNIIFENIYSDNAKIIIQDDGKGMDYEDLMNKWLFVAYSAKKEGTEDENEKNDYRNKIKLRKYYAGAKGVGRFSCDRLGTLLNLISIKNNPNPKIENLKINWENFEEDSLKEFKNINVFYSSLNSTNYKLLHGTVLEISNLKDKWDRSKIFTLKDSLSKLILPENNESDFRINIIAKDEELNDFEYKKYCKENGLDLDYKKIINSPVKNFIFETLNLKTTSITTAIDKEGDTVNTKLNDRGINIYEIIEKNNYKDLKNIKISLFFLNQAAKFNFTKLMGVHSVNYGHVFVYKNGFRILPYGEERDDSLGVDTRKAQGVRRYLGTREIIGRIEIGENNDTLNETTSRAGGLIKTLAYNELKLFFFDILRKLEKYVVDTKEWGVDDDELRDLYHDNTKEKLVKLISNITSDSDVITIKYNEKIIELVNLYQSDSAGKIIKNFKRMAAESDNPELSKKVKLLEKKYIDLTEAKKEAEKELELTENEKKKIENNLNIEKKKNIYLLATTKDTPQLIGLIHHIELATDSIDSSVNVLLKDVSKDNFNKKIFFEKLKSIKTQIFKVLKISKLITRSNFNAEVAERNADLVKYIEEYINLYHDIHRDLKIKVKIESNIEKFSYFFSFLDISVIIDNLISNAKKNFASNFLIKMEKLNNGLKIVFSDDGQGVSQKLQEHIFDLGVTSTTGSGIGLFIINDTVKQMGGKIKFLGNNVLLKGASFELIFQK